MLKWWVTLTAKTNLYYINTNLKLIINQIKIFITLDFKKFFLILIIFFLIIANPIKVYSAEILQINNSSNILVGDLNRNLSIKLFCVDINNEYDEITAINLLKKEFPRGSKVKIRPIGFNENILIAKVFNINETKEMSDLLIANDLTKGTCHN